MGFRNTHWTPSLSNHTSCDLEKAADRSSSDTASDLQAIAPRTSQLSPPISRERNYGLAGEENGPSSFGSEDPSPVRRPLYLSLSHSERSLSSSFARAKENCDNDEALAQHTNKQPLCIGSTEDADQEPLEQLRLTSSASSDCQEPEAMARSSVSGVARLSWPSTITPPKAHNSSAASPKPKSAAWRRPNFTPGLPTSFSHENLGSQRTWPSDSPRSYLPFPRALHYESTASSVGRMPASQQKRRTVCVGQSQAVPVAVPSPAIPLQTSQDHTWQSYTTGLISSQPKSSSIASFYSNPDASVHRASSSDNGHCRCPSLTFSAQTQSTSPAGSDHPVTHPSPPGAEVQGSITGRSRAVRFGSKRDHAIRHDTDPTSSHSQKLPRVFASRPASETPPGRCSKQGQSQVWSQGSSSLHLTASKPTLSVTTELVYNSRYLEPYNSCEVIMLPRPRLRFRSFGDAPAALMERIHAAPERFWQHDTGNGPSSAIQLVPLSKTNASSSRAATSSRAQTRNECVQPVRSPRRDARLVLHDSIPPPLPPKEPAHPSPGLLPSKPLPPIPSSNPAMDQVQRASADSTESLEASELLALNRQFEGERKAWREQHHNSLGVNVGELCGCLGPCCKELTVTERLKCMEQTQLRDEDGRVTHITPLKAHRNRNRDGRQQAFLVVRGTNKNPYSDGNKSISNPDLGGNHADGRQCLPLVDNLATRFSSLSRASRAQVLPLQAAGMHESQQHVSQSLSTPKAEDKTPGATPGNIKRALGRGRTLVSDETMIIGLPTKHAQNEKLPDVTTVKEAEASQERERAKPMNGGSFCSAQRVQVFGYRPSGSQDDIKAQLGEHQQSPMRRPLRALRGTYHPQEIGGDGPSWINPGMYTPLNGELVLPSRIPVPARSEARQAAQRGHLTYDASDRRSEADCVRQASRGQDSAPEALMTNASTVPSARTTTSSGQQVQRQRQNASSAPLTSTEKVARSHAFGTDESLRQSERSSSSDSAASSQTNRNLTLWDASSVNIENLFFRPPPPSRLPSS